MDIIQKYKPTKLEELIGNENIKKLLENIPSDNIPNLLISGDYGTGKTLLLNIFLKKLDIKKHNILYINLDNDLKKNNIKNSKLFNFLKKSEKNVIIIDNYFEIPLDKQYILRSFIKNYNINSSFIILLNNITNIIKHLSNYFLIFKLKHISTNEYFNYMKNIVVKENIHINDDILNYIIEISDNFRDVINNFTIILNYYMNIDNENINYESILNISDKQNVYDIINLCDKTDIYNAIKLIDKLLLNGYSIIDIINMLILYIKQIDINYEKKIKYIEIISFMQIKINNNLNTYTQLCCLLSKLCQVQ